MFCQIASERPTSEKWKDTNAFKQNVLHPNTKQCLVYLFFLIPTNISNPPNCEVARMTRLVCFLVPHINSGLHNLSSVAQDTGLPIITVVEDF